MRRIYVLFTVMSLLLATTIVTWAKGPKIADPAKVDADFAYQGEYSGPAGEDGAKLGIQVIALGEGQFQAVGYSGGLPGDGWDGDRETLIQATGKLENGEVKVVSPEKGSAIIKKDGTLQTFDLDGQKVHQLKRVVRKSKTLGQKPPEGAIVLFDGSSADGWENGKMTDDGLLMQGTTSKKKFQDHQLHIEFRIPYQPQDRGQGRGNSGIYVQGRYEVQMLDSFGLAGKQNECGGLYSVKDPDLNMCLPPLSWQTYDIEYTAARFDDAGKLLKNPRVTIKHNAVVIHKDVELPGERNTTAAPSQPGPEAGPIYLQNHGCPVRYRNIWVVPKTNK
ncbi:MAG: DUF1080 domain-containing protein [Pirellulaceae bacterium]